MTAPPTPRPKRRPGKRSQEPVTPGATDTPPDRDAEPGDISAAAAAAEDHTSPPPKAKARPKSAPAPRTNRDKRQRKLEELFAAPALIYSATGDEWAARFLTARAEPMATAWADLAEESLPVRRIIDRLTTGSAWGGVIFATGGTVLPMLVHHGVLPDSLPIPGLPEEEEGSGSPIVPPPPMSEGPTPPGPATPGPVGVGRTPPPPHGFTDMTPPVKPGQPPGVVTVAGSNNRAAS